MSVRPPLTPCQLPSVFPQRGANYITCSPGQWDALLKQAYERGWTLLEIEVVNGQEKVVRSYKKDLGQN